jgi:DNA-binding response OmpR family regulator
VVRQQAPEAEDASTAFAGSTVLIVERDAAFADALAASFAQAGFVVRRAANGGDALEEVAWEQPHLIVLDLDMPAVAGGRLLDVLRAQPTTRSVPLLALATFSYQEAGAALRAGADDCLLKPLPPDQVVDAARDLLTRSGRWTHLVQETDSAPAEPSAPRPA